MPDTIIAPLGGGRGVGGREWYHTYLYFLRPKSGIKNRNEKTAQKNLPLSGLISRKKTDFIVHFSQTYVIF